MSDIVLENGLPPEEAPAEPAAEVVAETTAEAPAPEAWAPTREDWESLNSRLDSFAQQFAPPAPEPQAPDFSSYADPTSGEVTLEGLQRFISDQVQAGVNARMAQVEPVLNQTIAERGEALIAQKFDSLKTELGGEFNTNVARVIAEGYAAQGHDPDTAIRQAAREAFEFAQAERKAAVEQYQSTLKNISNAPREAGVNAAGLPDEGMPADYQGDKYKWLADNWAARTKLGS